MPGINRNPPHHLVNRGLVTPRLLVPRTRVVLPRRMAKVGDQKLHLGHGMAFRRSAGNLIYTVPANAQKAIIRKITLTNRGITDPATGGSGRALARIMLGGDLLVDVKLDPGQFEVIEPNLVLLPNETLGVREICEMNGSSATLTQNTSGSSTTDATSYATASWTSVVDGIYMLTVANSKASAVDIVSSISADATHGVEWVEIDNETNAAGTIRITTFRTKAKAAGSGTTTINFGATQTGAIWGIVRFIGGCTVGQNGEEAIQEAGTRRQFPNIANLFVPVYPWGGGAVASFVNNGASSTHTPGHGIELTDTASAEPLALHTFYDMTPRTVMWSTFASTPANGIGMAHNLQDTRAPQVFASVEGVEIA